MSRPRTFNQLFDAAPHILDQALSGMISFQKIGKRVRKGKDMPQEPTQRTVNVAQVKGRASISGEKDE